MSFSETLAFTTRSVRNTTLATPDDRLYYEVVTRFWHPSVTKINVLDPETQRIRTVAEVETVGLRNAIPQHRVRFVLPPSDAEDRFGPWVDGEDFVRPGGDGKSGGLFEDASGVEYRWKTHNGKLQLVRTDDPDKTPLVLYRPHKRFMFVLRMAKYAVLEITPEVTALLDRLIVSYIIVERRRRARTKPL